MFQSSLYPVGSFVLSICEVQTATEWQILYPVLLRNKNWNGKVSQNKSPNKNSELKATSVPNLNNIYYTQILAREKSVIFYKKFIYVKDKLRNKDKTVLDAIFQSDIKRSFKRQGRNVSWWHSLSLIESLCFIVE